MTMKSLGAVVLLLAPSGLAYLAGYSEVAHYVGFGALLAPVLVLMSDHGAPHGPPLDYLTAVLPAFLPVLLVAGLGHWMYWTLRADSGHVPV